MEFYHVLNRGVDKRNIFLNDKDHLRFVHDLFEFNDTANAVAVNYYAQSTDVGRPKVGRKRELLVYLHCFCLMPNHYHLLLSPARDNGIPLFMKKLNGGYAKYFNEKYKRIGALFQGKYKSVSIQRDAHFLHIPFYIHFNPLDLIMPEWRQNKLKNIKKAEQYLESYRWSSHSDYLGHKNFSSVTQRNSLSKFFENKQEYKNKTREMLRFFNDDDLIVNNLE